MTSKRRPEGKGGFVGVARKGEKSGEKSGGKCLTLKNGCGKVGISIREKIQWKINNKPKRKGRESTS